MNVGEICNREVVIACRDTRVAGLITLDDLMELIAEELADAVKTVTRERARETRMRPG